MNYQRQYDLLIEKARTRGTVDGYKERHHIVPRCMGGSNAKDNLVELTAREHYVAHRLLYMQYKTAKLAYAWHGMMVAKDRRTFTSRQYARIKEVMSGDAFSTEHRKKLSEAKKGKPCSDENRVKISATQKGRPRGPQSAEHKRKIGEAQKGRVFSEEHKKNIRLALARKRSLR